jgi:GGDEF domain-containing protein
VAIFTPFGRRRTDGLAQGPPPDQSEAWRHLLPARFEAVAEALASTTDPGPACAVVGRDVARDGAFLGEALDGLRATFHHVVGTDPDVASVEALSLAWSEATLEFLHELSCEDPLTGLASLAHLRARLGEVYRGAQLSRESVAVTHALVVVELSPLPGSGRAEHQFTRALHLVQVTETVRSVFSGEETIARLNTDRVAVVVRRAATLGASVGTLRERLRGLDLGASDVRLWIEGLPPFLASATRLLDEVAR